MTVKVKKFDLEANYFVSKDKDEPDTNNPVKKSKN